MSAKITKWINILNDLSNHINKLYGYVQIEGDNLKNQQSIQDLVVRSLMLSIMHGI